MTTWIKFTKDDEEVDLGSNSKMTDFFIGRDFKQLIDGVINHKKEQTENPALLDSKFIFNEVLFLLS